MKKDINQDEMNYQRMSPHYSDGEQTGNKRINREWEYSKWIDDDQTDSEQTDQEWEYSKWIDDDQTDNEQTNQEWEYSKWTYDDQNDSEQIDKQLADKERMYSGRSNIKPTGIGHINEQTEGRGIKDEQFENENIEDEQPDFEQPSFAQPDSEPLDFEQSDFDQSDRTIDRYHKTVSGNMSTDDYPGPGQRFCFDFSPTNNHFELENVKANQYTSSDGVISKAAQMQHAKQVEMALNHLKKRTESVKDAGVSKRPKHYLFHKIEKRIKEELKNYPQMEDCGCYEITLPHIAQADVPEYNCPSCSKDGINGNTPLSEIIPDSPMSSPAKASHEAFPAMPLMEAQPIPDMNLMTSGINSAGGNTAKVRLLNGNKHYELISAAIGDDASIQDVSYLQSSPYWEVNQGFQTVTLQAAQSSDIILKKTFPFCAGIKYTLALIPTDKGADIMLVHDMAVPFIPDDMGCLKITNLSNTSQPLDLLIHEDESIFNEVNFKEITSCRPFESGVHEFHLRNSQNNETLVSILMNIEPGRMYTAYILGSQSQKDILQFLVLEDVYQI